MAYFNALLQHQGPLKHVSHAHRVATGSYWTADKGAASEAKYLNDAARAVMTSSDGFATVERAMKTILGRAGERDYIGYLNEARDYRDALAYLGHFVLGQPSEYGHWYDAKRKLVQFMFYTANGDALKYVRRTMSYSEDANKFYTVLSSFQNLALSRNDGEAANMAAQLLGRVR